MSKSNTFENELLRLLFLNEALTLIGDAAGLQPSAAPGSLYVSLHTADPGEGGTQSTSEATYTGYTRVPVARSGVGWTVTGNAVENTAAVDFGECSAGSSNATHFGVGCSSSGVGKLLHKGALSTPLAVSVGVQPRFVAGSLDIAED